MSKLRKALHATKAPFHGSDPPIEAGVDPCTQLLRKNHAIHHRSDEKGREKADREPVTLHVDWRQQQTHDDGIDIIGGARRGCMVRQG